MDNLEYKGYFGSIEYSPEEEYYFGEVLGLPKNTGIIYEGGTKAALYQDFIDGIESYLDYCDRHHKMPHKSYEGVEMPLAAVV